MNVPTHQDLLHVLSHLGAQASVREMMDYLPEDMDRSTISTKLCRMRDKGWTASELRDGINYWTLTAEGSMEAQQSAAPTPPASPPEQPVSSDSDPQPIGSPDPIALELMAAMEIEVALDAVRAALRAPAIPARALRVYLQIIENLPEVLREALSPITERVSEVRPCLRP